MSLLDAGYSKVNFWIIKSSSFKLLHKTLCYYYSFIFFLFFIVLQCLMESQQLPMYISKLREIQYAVRQQSIIATQQV